MAISINHEVLALRTIVRVLAKRIAMLEGATEWKASMDNLQRVIDNEIDVTPIDGIDAFAAMGERVEIKRFAGMIVGPPPSRGKRR